MPSQKRTADAAGLEAGVSGARRRKKNPKKRKEPGPPCHECVICGGKNAEGTWHEDTALRKKKLGYGARTSSIGVCRIDVVRMRH